MELLNKYYSKLYHWFADIPYAEVNKILIRSFDADDRFILKGRPFENVYIILDGICSVVNQLDNGTEIITLRLTQGDVIGVSESILNSVRNIASVNPCTSLVVAEIDDRTFKNWLNTYPSFRDFVLKNIVVRLHYTADFSANCQTSSSKINLVKYLVDRYQVELTSYAPNYSGSVKIHETHEVIGTFLGLSPRTVDRNIRSLKNDGFISTERGKIHISSSQYQELLHLVTSNL